MWQHDRHYPPQGDRPELRNLSRLSNLRGPSHFADADHPDQAARQVAGLLRLGQLHGTEALQAAAVAALSANVRSYRFVQQLLAKGRIEALEQQMAQREQVFRRLTQMLGVRG